MIKSVLKYHQTYIFFQQLRNIYILNQGNLFYSGYILPLIDYFCGVWGNCSNEGLICILKLQKRTARLILDQDPIAPFEPLFKQLGWMTIEQRIKYHKYLLVSKCLKNEAPIQSNLSIATIEGSSENRSHKTGGR